MKRTALAILLLLLANLAEAGQTRIMKKTTVADLFASTLVEACSDGIRIIWTMNALTVSTPVATGETEECLKVKEETKGWQ